MEGNIDESVEVKVRRGKIRKQLLDNCKKQEYTGNRKGKL